MLRTLVALLALSAPPSLPAAPVPAHAVPDAATAIQALAPAPDSPLRAALKLPAPIVIDPEQEDDPGVQIAPEFDPEPKEVLDIAWFVVWSGGKPRRARQFGPVIEVPYPRAGETITVGAVALVLDAEGKAVMTRPASTSIALGKGGKPSTPGDPPGDPVPIPAGANLYVNLVIDTIRTTRAEAALADSEAVKAALAKSGSTLHKPDLNSPKTAARGLKKLVDAAGGAPCLIVQRMETDPATGQVVGRVLGTPQKIAVSGDLKRDEVNLLDAIGKAAAGAKP